MGGLARGAKRAKTSPPTVLPADPIKLQVSCAGCRHARGDRTASRQASRPFLYPIPIVKFYRRPAAPPGLELQLT